MATYMAEKIMLGKMDYMLLNKSIYKKYKADVDTILIAEGRSDLIIDFE